MTAKLRSGALSLTESLVMGVAGSAPGFSIAVALASLIGTAGLLAPGALMLFAIPMVGITVAYKGLGARMPNAGAGYEWASRLFGKPFGFASGWALLVASAVFTVTGSSPLGAAMLSFVDPGLASNVVLTTAIGAACFLIIGVVLMVGIGLTSKVQMIMSGIEIVIRGEGPRVLLDPTLRETLAGGASNGTVEPRAAGAWLANALAQEAGGTIQLSDPASDVLMIGVQLPAQG